jgi:hypothetical protein
LIVSAAPDCPIGVPAETIQGVHVDAGVQQQRRSDQRGGVGKVQFGVVAARQRPPEALRLDAA